MVVGCLAVEPPRAHTNLSPRDSTVNPVGLAETATPKEHPGAWKSTQPEQKVERMTRAPRNPQGRQQKRDRMGEKHPRREEKETQEKIVLWFPDSFCECSPQLIIPQVRRAREDPGDTRQVGLT